MTGQAGMIRVGVCVPFLRELGDSAALLPRLDDPLLADAFKRPDATMRKNGLMTARR